MLKKIVDQIFPFVQAVLRTFASIWDGGEVGKTGLQCGGLWRGSGLFWGEPPDYLWSSA